MSRIALPSRDEIPSASLPVLNAVQAKLGLVPNLYRLIALSPSALQGFAALEGELSKTLELKTRERIALAVAQLNGCDYCLSAHTYLGLNLAKLGADEVALNRKGASGDPKADAAVRFAARVAAARGKVSDADLAAIRHAGFADSEIVEIVALVAANVLTNFVNNVADTEIDFPAVHAAAAA